MDKTSNLTVDQFQLLNISASEVIEPPPSSQRPRAWHQRLSRYFTTSPNAGTPLPVSQRSTRRLPTPATARNNAQSIQRANEPLLNLHSNDAKFNQAIASNLAAPHSLELFHQRTQMARQGLSSVTLGGRVDRELLRKLATQEYILNELRKPKLASLEQRLDQFVQLQPRQQLNETTYLRFLESEQTIAYATDVIKKGDPQRIIDIDKLYREPGALIAAVGASHGKTISSREQARFISRMESSRDFRRDQQAWIKFRTTALETIIDTAPHETAATAIGFLFDPYGEAAYRLVYNAQGDDQHQRQNFLISVRAFSSNKPELYEQLFYDLLIDQLHTAVTLASDVDTKQRCDQIRATVQGLAARGLVDSQKLEELLPNSSTLHQPSQQLHRASDLITPLYIKVSAMATVPRPVAAARVLADYASAQLAAAQNSPHHFASSIAMLRLMPVRLDLAARAVGLSKKEAEIALQLAKPMLARASNRLSALQQGIALNADQRFESRMTHALKEVFTTEATFIGDLTDFTDPTSASHIEAYLNAKTPDDPFSPYLAALTNFVGQANTHLARQHAASSSANTDQAKLTGLLTTLASAEMAQYFEGLVKLSLLYYENAHLDRSITQCPQPQGVSRRQWRKLLLKGVPAYLISPVQRGPRWEMLLKEVDRHTPTTHPQKTEISQAQQLASTANEITSECLRLRDAAALSTRSS